MEDSIRIAIAICCPAQGPSERWPPTPPGVSGGWFRAPGVPVGRVRLSPKTCMYICLYLIPPPNIKHPLLGPKMCESPSKPWFLEFHSGGLYY